MRIKGISVVVGSIFVVVALLLMPFVATAQKEPVVIGGVTHFTGPSAPFGVSVSQGAKLAIEEYNAKGGILGGREVVVKWEDDKCIPSEAVSAMKKLISQGVRLYTSQVLSGTILAMIPVAKENGCILVNATGMHPKVAGDGTSFSMIGAAEVMQGEHTERIIKRFKPKTVYLVHVNDDYGRSVNKAIKEKLLAHGIKIVGEAFIEHGEMEFRTLLTKIKAIHPDIWILNHNGIAQTVAAWEQSIEVGVRDKMVMSWEMLSDRINLARREVCEGIWGTTMWSPTLDFPVSKKFVSDFVKKYNVKPHEVSDMSAVGWQAVVILVEAVKKVGNETDIEAIRKAIWETDLEGLWGRVRIDPKWGRPYYTPVEYIIHNKAYVVQKPK